MKKKPVIKTVNNVHNVNEMKELFRLSTSWIAVKLLSGNFTRKRRFRILARSLCAHAWENRPMVHEKPSRWSRKAGGRYLQCSFCMKLSVHEKAVFGSKWPLFTVVAEARFYWQKLWTCLSCYSDKTGSFSVCCYSVHHAPSAALGNGSPKCRFSVKCMWRR